VDYIEAHGTGTPLGDPIEIDALWSVLKKRLPKNKKVLVGSVKTNIGHLEGAAGVAALIKVVLSLENKKIPPHLHFNEPNPYIDWENISIEVPTSVSKWEKDNETRAAGVSSFGFSGTNAHVVVAEAPVLEPVEKGLERPFHLLKLSAKTEPALHALWARYADYFNELREKETKDKEGLSDICYTANVGRNDFSYRACIVGQDSESMQAQLSKPLNAVIDPVVLGRQSQGHRPGKVAFLFTGQGAQTVGMARQLFETEQGFRDTLSHCGALLRSELSVPFLELLYGEQASAEQLQQTEFTQPVLFAVEYALAKLWQQWGIQPNYVMGHSVGEYVAACIAGVFSLEDALKLISARGRLMQRVGGEGAMLAVMTSDETAKALIRDEEEIWIAAYNGPNQTVLSGSPAAVDRVVQRLESREINHQRLQVSHAFHSPLLEPMLEEFRQVAESIAYKEPQLRVVSNVTGELIGEEMARADYWVNHVRQPVRFHQGMQTLHEQGIEHYVEIGPKPVLIGMGRQCVKELDESNGPTWVASLQSGMQDWQSLLEGLGSLYEHGMNVDWSALDRNYKRRKVVLPTYPFQRSRYWIDSLKSKNETRNHQYVNSSNTIHELLGHRIRLARSKEIRYESYFTIFS
jgi:malonyl CoA-acyl carrier protein transacylase